MARTNRQSKPSVKDILYQQPYSFEFHQAIKILEQLNPEAKPFGDTVDFFDEPVIVKSRIFLESLASDIYAIDIDGSKTYPLTKKYLLRSDEPPILQVNFMGLAGIQGPLPFPYTEIIIQRIRNGDTSLRDFLDIFNHRLISILHRIRKQYMLALNTLTPEKTAYGRALKSFVGIGTPSVSNRLSLEDRGLLNFAGFFWARQHCVQGLEQFLKTYFNIPIKVESCVGRWRNLATSDWTRIGQTGQWQKLGQGAVLGTRAWDHQSHFHIQLGESEADKLYKFFPLGEGYRSLNEVVKLYINPEHDYSLNYIIKKETLPELVLGNKSYLGWRTWLISKVEEKETRGKKLAKKVEKVPKVDTQLTIMIDRMG